MGGGGLAPGSHPSSEAKKSMNKRQVNIFCPKNNLNISIKTEPVTAGADTVQRYMSGFCTNISGPEPDIYVESVCTVTGSWFVCKDSDYFWDSVQ